MIKSCIFSAALKSSSSQWLVWKEVDIDVSASYVNCRLSGTAYRILANLGECLGLDIPFTGLATSEVYKRFKTALDSSGGLMIVVLDELDTLVKNHSDSILYELTRINELLKNGRLSIIGISNDIKFKEFLDPRVISSLSEEELVFPPYNAIQLQDILNDRCERAFKDGVVNEGVIAKCAAYAAREHGDARRALDLLRIAGELSEREGEKKISEDYIDLANNKMERDKILDIVESEPKQFQLVLYSILQLTKQAKNGGLNKFYTGDVYNNYQTICNQTKVDVLTQRRISDILAEIDMLGLINARVISKGRHGRTREIKLSIPSNLLDKVETILIDSLCI